MKKRLRIVWNDPLHGIHRWKWKAALVCWLLNHRRCCLVRFWLVAILARRIRVECEMRSEWSMELAQGLNRPVAFALKCTLPNRAEVKWWVPCGGWTHSAVIRRRPFDFSYSRIKHRLARRILRSQP
jgi:hypothetical protein